MQTKPISRPLVTSPNFTKVTDIQSGFPNTTKQSYILGIDFILHEKGIKILEMQSIFQCGLDQAIDMTGKNPLKRLVQALNIKHKDMDMSLPPRNATPSQIRLFSKRASLLEDKNTIPNKGIDTLLVAKWLFYSFCNSYSDLKIYIPQTFIETLQSIDSEFLSNLRNNSNYLFKPADQSLGNGIVKIPKFFNLEQLKSFFSQQNICRYYGPNFQDQFGDNFPFLIQEYLTDKKGHSLPVIRTYAAVVIDYSLNNPILDILVDKGASTIHERIDQNNYDFKVNNNSCKPNTIIPEIQAHLKDFLSVFFNKCLKPRKIISEKHWLRMALYYSRNTETLSPTKRLNILAQFALSLQQEIRFNNVPLTSSECFIIEDLLNKFAIFDLENATKHNFIVNFFNSFAILANEYLEISPPNHGYGLYYVLQKFLSILKMKSAMSKYVDYFEKILKKYSPPFKGPNFYTGIFSYLNKSELVSVSQISKKERENVLHFHERFLKKI